MTDSPMTPPEQPASPQAEPQPAAEETKPAEAAAPRGEQPRTAPPREGGPRESGDRRGGRGGGRWRYQSRRKVCQFSAEKLPYIDYKDVDRLRRYISDRGKMESRRKTGTRARYQRMLSVAIKRARYMALMPYTSSHIRESGGVGGRA